MEGLPELTAGRTRGKTRAGALLAKLVIVDPGTGGVLSCVLNRNNTQELDSETSPEPEEQEQSQINKSRKQE